ncbi:MAG: hypothetical protein V1686_01810 [Patescibacteria group bacterium]
MLNKFQKIIISSIIFCLIFGFVFNIFLTRPKIVQATDGGAGFLNLMKETVLDAVGWGVTDMVLKPLKQKIQDWGMGKTSDSNTPFFVMDWKKFWDDALDIASAKFIEELGATKLCGPLQISIGQNPTFTTYYSDKPQYKNYSACTLDNVVDNVESFFKNPSISVYGWDAWTALTQPNNNFLGAYLMAAQRQDELAQEELDAKNKETAVSEGTKNETTTKATDTDTCNKKCDTDFPTTTPGNDIKWNDCLDKCETTTKGVPTQSGVKNLGATIKENMDKALGADMSRIISADEISELVGVFFSAVLNKAIDGLGLVPSSANQTTQEQNRNENKDLYGYGTSVGQTITPEMQKDIRTTILNGTLKGVQMISRATAKCKDEKTMLTELDFNKNITDMYSAQLEALYVGTTGIALKPDFTVLDSPFAPFSLYGYRWGEIPVNKIPAKCKKMITQSSGGLTASCKDIVSGLEPNYSKQCTQCIYDDSELNCPPAPYPPFSKPSVLTKAVVTAKQEFYSGCMNWYEVTTNRCKECVKKTDEKCDQEDGAQKQACIESVCSNYEDLKPHVVSTISSGIDFHSKCLLEETKTSCFTCLKEYFMPASYCDDMSAFTARALIKYPGVVLMGDARTSAYFIGRYDSTFADAFEGGTKCNNDRDAKKAIDVSLICQIMPDFEDNGIKVCKQYCMGHGMTEAELNDIVDNRPTNEDCNNQKLNIGGSINVWNTVSNGNFQQLSKCCAATNTTDLKRYQTCIGGSKPLVDVPPVSPCTFAKPVNQEPECYCNDGERPLGWAKAKVFPEYTNESDISFCTDFEFQSPGTKRLRIYTDSTPGGAVVYIGKDSCTYNGTYKLQEPTSTACPPSNPLFMAETSFGTNSQEFYYNLSDTGTLHGGVFNNDLTDTKATTMHVCAPCDPSDTGYPNYGTSLNQCSGKLSSTSGSEGSYVPPIMPGDCSYTPPGGMPSCPKDKYNRCIPPQDDDPMCECR